MKRTALFTTIAAVTLFSTAAMASPEKGTFRRGEHRADYSSHSNHYTPKPAPVVHQYWPQAGEAGTQVVIRGRWMGDNSKVVFGNRIITPVAVSNRSLTFVVPKRSRGSSIAVRVPGYGDISVGHFNVTTPAPHAPYATPRSKRRDRAVAQLNRRYERTYLRTPAVRAEFRLHARRMARLNRALSIAQYRDNVRLANRVQVLIRRENRRHNWKMSQLQISYAAVY